MSAISRFFFPNYKSNTVIVRSQYSHSSRYDQYSEHPLHTDYSSGIVSTTGRNGNSTTTSSSSRSSSSSSHRLPSLSPNGSLIFPSNDPSLSLLHGLLELNDTTCSCLVHWQYTSQHLQHHRGQLTFVSSLQHPIFQNNLANTNGCQRTSSSISSRNPAPSIYDSAGSSNTYSPSGSLILSSTSTSATGISNTSSRSLQCDVCGHNIYDIGLQGLFLCLDYPRCSFIMCIVCNFREHAPLSITVPNHHPQHRLYRFCDGFTRINDNRRQCNLCGQLVRITLMNMIWSCVEDDIDVCTDCFAALDLYRYVPRSTSYSSSSSSTSSSSLSHRERRDKVNYGSHKCPLYRFELFDYVIEEQKRTEDANSGSDYNNPDSRTTSSSVSSVGLSCKACRNSLPALLRAAQNITDEAILPIASSVYACEACHYALCGPCITTYIGNWSLTSLLSSNGRKHNTSLRTLSSTRSSPALTGPSSSSRISPNSRSRTLFPLARAVDNSFSPGSESTSVSNLVASVTTPSSTDTAIATQLKVSQESVKILQSEIKAVRKQLKHVLSGKEIMNSRNELTLLRTQLTEYKTLMLLMNDTSNLSIESANGTSSPSTTGTVIGNDTTASVSLTTHQYLQTMTDESITDMMKKMEHSLTILKSEYQRRQLCIICCDQPHNVFFLPCTHVCACMPCSNKLTTCPVCREEIQERVEIPKDNIHG